jgi:arginine-tRNA-protein transferase
MARLLEHYREAPHQCSYLPDQRASLDVMVMLDVTARDLGLLLERGWRRFGPTYFRPGCAHCDQCEPLRIPTRTFQPTTSQRRARRTASSLIRQVQAPVVDAERTALYARWHSHREQHRGWAPNAMDEERYAFEFAFHHPAVREVTFREPAQHRLVGVGIVDDVPDALSAVFFFWDPELAPPSLGVAHVVMLVEEAAQRGLDHVYLGYRVAQCPSLAYKGRYGPHELLLDRPALDEPPRWQRPARPAAASTSA